ncbi:MAG: methyltransferase domain-containing protein [Gammaproteobacteria bacterium]|nr:methyltransferase domain-containing protein [Gammaproteobacteria bacterium]
MNSVNETASKVIAVLDTLGISRAHLVAWASADWGGLVARHANRFATLTLAFPAMRLGTPDVIGLPTLSFASDQGNGPVNTRRLMERAPQAKTVIFEGYHAPLWNDLIADNARRIEKETRAHLASHPIPVVSLAAGPGRVGDIHYTVEGAGVEGAGPPVVLMPIGLVPSQWGPVRESLARDYCVISLGGAPLGMVATLEARAQSGYGAIIHRLIDEAAPAADSKMLEVGCGHGPLVRPLAARRAAGPPITGIDINAYLLDEGRALAQAQGLAKAIDFRYANAHALPFADDSFDVVFCSTVMEEGHADRMLAEMARVIRPGGRVVVAVRAVDMPWWVNLEEDAAIRRTLNELAPKTSSGAGPDGCADASLYRRVMQAGFEHVRMRLQLAVYAGDARALEVRERLLAMLQGDELERAAAAIANAEKAGSFFIAEPFHAAIGHTATGVQPGH